MGTALVFSHAHAVAVDVDMNACSRSPGTETLTKRNAVPAALDHPWGGGESIAPKTVYRRALRALYTLRFSFMTVKRSDTS